MHYEIKIIELSLFHKIYPLYIEKLDTNNTKFITEVSKKYIPLKDTNSLIHIKRQNVSFIYMNHKLLRKLKVGRLNKY